MLLARTSRGAARRAAAIAFLCSLLLPAMAVAAPVETDAFSRALEQGPLYAAGAAFVGGLLVSLTPCVYPMIVITVSVFGARQAKSRGQAMLLSTSFVLGIVAMFVPLGVVAGLTGSVFGEALSNRWVNVVIAVVFLALAASMFGAFEMVLPSGLTQRLSKVGGIGYGGGFLLGLVCGIMAAPCTGPVLTGILIWIGKIQSAGMGAAAMLAFALGLGLPFWLVGTFAISLPKSGKWMVAVKSLFGVLITIAALYFLSLAFPRLVEPVSGVGSLLLIAAAVAVAGVALGAVHLDWSDGGWPIKLRKGVGIALATVGGFGVVAALLGDPAPAAAGDQTAQGADRGPLLTFMHSEAEAVAKARAEKRPLLVDFTAKWCIACGKLSRITFANPQVRKKAARFVAVKVDLSVNEDLSDEEQERQEEQFDAIQKKYGVVGLPTVILYDSQGKERARLRDFVSPEDFLKIIEGIE